MAVILRNCPHCPAEHVSFTLRWGEKPPGGAGKIWNCAADCGACGKPIAFQTWLASNSPTSEKSPASEQGAIEPKWVVNRHWPSRVVSVAPAHTPPAIARRFLEGERSFAHGNWNAAVAMYRSTLDIATKALDGVPGGLTFFARLKWLHENHRITPDMRDWADHVRVEGNEALHDPEEFEEVDANTLRLFTETFLRYIFELPGEVKAFREGPQEELAPVNSGGGAPGGGRIP